MILRRRRLRTAVAPRQDVLIACELGRLRAAVERVRRRPLPATAPAAPAVDVLAVCSPGGHLFEALALSSAWSGHTQAWVSLDKPDVRSLLARKRVFFAHGPTERSLRNLVRNLILARRVIREVRPRILVTTGAGVGVPFAWMARLSGAHIIYVESAGRVDGPSLSARLIAPVAHRVYVQWPELTGAVPRARYVGNVLAAARKHAPPSAAASGVLVTVGVSEVPFDRLVAAAGELTDEPVIVQRGPSAVRASRARCFEFLPFAELEELMDHVRVIVCHAGLGSVAAAHAHGLRPVVVPRRQRFGEAVDDHQVLFARRLGAAGLATVVEDVEHLPSTVRMARTGLTGDVGPDPAAELAHEVDEALGAASS